MEKSRWIDPYYKNKKGNLVCTIRDCWTCAQAGVYLIRHKQTESIVYVGSSTSQLKKTIYRHFQQWTDKQRKGAENYERKTYPKTGHYEIRFFKCTADQALKMEKFLIKKYQPKDNPLKYKQLTISYIKQGERLHQEALESEFIPKRDYVSEAAPF